MSLRNWIVPQNFTGLLHGSQLKCVIAAIASLMAGACSTSADVNADEFSADAMTISQDAASCRRSLADNIEYGPVARRMPLVDIYQATVQQMADTRLASANEVSALLAWAQELQKCRYKTLAAIRQRAPIALASVLTAWNGEDEVFVLLSKRRLSWGDAVIRLRSNRADLLSKLTEQAFRESAQLSASKQAELSRRVSILNALTNLAP